MKINTNSGAAASLFYFSRKFVCHFSLLLSLMLMPFALGGLAVFEAEGTAYAAQGGNGGGGGGGNGNGGTGGPDKGDLYGDSVYLLRNPDTGVPVVINGCVRPVSVDGSVVLALNGDFATQDYTPETDSDKIEGWFNCDPQDLAVAKSSATATQAEDEDSDELEACDPIASCVNYLEECDLGRLSLLRAPDDVLDQQLEEAITKLDKGSVSLDPSGRPVVGGETFDSPLLNLALFRELHLWGAVVEDPLGENERIVYEPNDFILAAAFALGGGDDKEGPDIDIEVAVRAAAIIHLGELIHELELIGESVFAGDAHLFKYLGTETYLVNYSGFSYDRAATFTGNICYDYYKEDEKKYYRESGSIIDIVFGGEVPEDPVEQLTGFALAASDARRVLVFVHDNLIQFADPVFENTPIDEVNCPPLQ